MLNPRPRSPFTNSMTWGSELHIASPVSGSRERDFMREKLFESVPAVAEEAREPSDLALTSRSEAGIRFWRLPPRMLCEKHREHRAVNSHSNEKDGFWLEHIRVIWFIFAFIPDTHSRDKGGTVLRRVNHSCGGFTRLAGANHPHVQRQVLQDRHHFNVV